ncbi:MAG: serine O-acetyltransferase, partial [Clostridia bacterium]|nr:serine O-acetyltransferase [Clostridia bacterium]
AVVLKDIPDQATAVGVPAHVVKIAGQRVSDIDQIHIPDPVAAAIERIDERISALEEKHEDI